MSEHTPGPWEVRKGDLQVFAGPAKENTPAVLRGHRCTIAECGDAYDIGYIRKSEATANANLIAAAPDLLAACEAAMRIEALWCPAACSAMPNPEEAMALDAMRRSFVDAIKKARGQQ